MVRFSLSAKQFMHRTSTHQQRRDRNFNFITSTLIGIVIALNSPAVRSLHGISRGDAAGNQTCVRIAADQVAVELQRV
jgi:hypothetical protein